MTAIIEEGPSREIEELSKEPAPMLESSEEMEEQSRTFDRVAWPFFI